MHVVYDYYVPTKYLLLKRLKQRRRSHPSSAANKYKTLFDHKKYKIEGMLRSLIAPTTVRTVRSVAVRSLSSKGTTGIVGLPVDPNGRDSLISICKEILGEVQGIPKDAAYRKNVEAIYGYRLSVAEKETDISKIESTIGLVHIEEVLEMAEDELSLVPKYIEGRMWEEP